MLPDRLRRRVGALNAFTVPMLRGPQPSAVDPAVLTELAHLCRDTERLRFEYRGHDGAASMARRTVEPHRLVCTERRWYLVAWDVDRADWRTFRVDRVTPKPPHGPRFAPRTPPADDLEVLEPPELVDVIRTARDRLSRAVTRSPHAGSGPGTAP